MANGVVVSPDLACLRISRANTIQAANPAQDELGPPVFRSVVMQCATPAFIGSNTVTEAQVSTVFGSGSNNNNSAFTPSLTDLFVNGANENAVAAFNLTSLGTFFDTADYVGAVRSTDAADAWYTGWTCNSATADFGSGNSGLCTSLPTD
jgi:hypothetical protein